MLYLWFSLHTHRRLFWGSPVYDATSEDESENEDEDEDDEAPVDLRTAIVVLLSSILMLVFCIVHLMRSFDAVIETRNVTVRSLGFIFIPYACSGAKNAIAVDLAMKNDMDGVGLLVSMYSCVTFRWLTIPNC